MKPTEVKVRATLVAAVGLEGGEREAPSPGGARLRSSAPFPLQLTRRAHQGLFDKGYTFLDIRTGAEYRSGNGLHWVW